MKKSLIGFLATIFLVGMWVAPAQAELGFKVGGATVDDVTTTACTTGDNQSVDMFGNGVSMDQVWRLEREEGSRGSGAWRPVRGFTDVFPTANGAAAVGGVEPLAVSTTAVLIPYWWAGTADDATGTVNKVNVDYVDFWASRPSS